MKLIRDQKGQSLPEVLIALAILGIVAVTFLTALSTASTSIIVADEHSTAESLSRSELEYIKNANYIPYSISGHEEYGFITKCPAGVCANGYGGYTIEVTTVPIDPQTHEPYAYHSEGDYYAADMGLQEITVVIKHHGDLVLTTTNYKALRR